MTNSHQSCSAGSGDENYEAVARAAGWIAEIEYNDEDDGVRHPETGNWAEDWKGACRQIGAPK
jgi:hypothetical protein